MPTPLEVKETFKGVDLFHFKGEYPQFQHRFNIPPGYSQKVGFPGYRFTRNEGLLTTDAFSCLVMVTITQDTWGLYHGGAFFSALRQEPLSDWHEAFFDFGDQVRPKREGLNLAFKLGVSLYNSREQALARRLAATELLLHAGFKNDEIITRWNNIFEGRVDVFIDPPQKQIGVRYDEFPVWLNRMVKPPRLLQLAS